MGFDFDICCPQDLLRVRAWGIAEDLEEFKRYSMAVLQAGEERQIDRIFCDERELSYGLSITDTYRLVEFLVDHTPARNRAALVCAPEDLSDALFWETTCVNRGLFVKAFTCIKEAEAWLVSKTP